MDKDQGLAISQPCEIVENMLTGRGRRLVVMIMERVLRECPILVAMSMVLPMPSLSDYGQGRDAHNGELAEYPE